MSARATFTKAQLRKTIEVMEEKGYRVGGVKPDGTVLVYVGDERPDGLSIIPSPEQAKRDTSWDDV